VSARAKADVAPRMTTGVIASVLFHAGIVAALVVFAAPRIAPPEPPPYRVQLIAAPAGDRAAGVVEPPVAPPVKSREPVPPSKTPPKVKPQTSAKVKPTPVQKAATPVPAAKTPTPPKTETPPPTAGGGATGGKGTDVANMDTGGIEFPYPWYLQNISREVIRQFQTNQTRLTLVADVSFMIKRDGTVDPGSIRLATSSGNYSFDQKALGAVEAAVNANRFGRLPDGFREDILPVTFRFTPGIR
jgi:outer membrane biosynthesis protein TonB